MLIMYCCRTTQNVAIIPAIKMPLQQLISNEGNWLFIGNPIISANSLVEVNCWSIATTKHAWHWWSGLHVNEKAEAFQGQFFSITIHSISSKWITLSMGYCKKDVTPVLMHCYIFLAITHRYTRHISSMRVNDNFDGCIDQPTIRTWHTFQSSKDVIS